MSERPRKARPTRSAVVVGKEWLSPGLVRIVLGGEQLATIPALEFTDSYIKLIFAPPGADYAWPFDPDAVRVDHPPEFWPVLRAYTVRWFDPTRSELALDVVVHGDAGIAGPWAATVEVGAAIGFFGPGGAYAPDPAAPRHLLVGDESALPAIAATLDALPTEAQVDVYLEVAGPADEISLRTTKHTKLSWVHRGVGPYGVPLAAAVRRGWQPDPQTQIFVHGNADLVRDLRRFLFVDNRHERRLVSISGYWRPGFTDEAWRATKREFVAQMDAAELAATTGEVAR